MALPVCGHSISQRQFVDFVDRELPGLTGTQMQNSQGICFGRISVHVL